MMILTTVRAVAYANPVNPQAIRVPARNPATLARAGTILQQIVQAKALQTQTNRPAQVTAPAQAAVKKPSVKVPTKFILEFIANLR